MHVAGAMPSDCGSWHTPAKLVGIERAHALDEVIADLRPREADAEVADVVTHSRRARREDREVDAAFAPGSSPARLRAGAHVIVGDFERRSRSAAPCPL